MSTRYIAVDEAIGRATALQSRFNIFTSIDGLASPVNQSGPLAGIPVAVKDLLDHAGRVTTCGSAFYRKTATTTASSLERLEEAGAVIIGRTGLHEFAFGFSSENPHFGPVRNPWNQNTSAGGSSGGSAAAVAAGIVPIAVGTDTGGSVRVPAAMCGCYGLKVTHGRIPIDGVFPLVPSIDTVGPLSNSAVNLETAYRVMAGDSGPIPDIGTLRFGIPQPWYDEAPMSDEVHASFVAATEAIQALGHQVHPIQLPDVLPDRRIIFAIAPEVIAAHRTFRSEGREYGIDVAERLDNAEGVSSEEAEEGRRWQEMVRARFADALATVDLLITPTVPSLRKTIGEDLIDGVHYRKVLSWFTAIVNHALLPAVALPLAGEESPPVSLQIIGPLNSELALIAMAHRFASEGVAEFVPAPTG